jgi:hypothetical protein
MTFKALLFFLFIIFNSAFAAKLKPIDVNHKWKENDTIESALLEHLDAAKINEKVLALLIKFNLRKYPQLTKPESNIVGKYVRLKIPEKYLRIDLIKAKFKPLSFLVYMLSSLGKFSEESSTLNYQASWGQNSPLTLGAGFNYYLSKDSLSAITGGLYYSYFLPSESTDPEFQNIKSLNEYGFVMQYQAAPDYLPFLVYFGLDYENFSTLNTAELIINGPPVDPVRHTLVFATVGLGHSIYLGKKPLLMKLNLSQTVTSSTSREIFNSGAYKGQKILASLTYPITNKIVTGIIYKKHILENSNTKIGVSRLGFTLGYAF